MYLNKLLKITSLLLISFLVFISPTFAGDSDDSAESDSFNNFILLSFFDLRDRESFVQMTNIDTIDGTVHVQIFDVSNNCNENNFFDTYTPNDTHVYNLRDVQTNNGNPSGVVLPDGAYGFVSIITVNPSFGAFDEVFNIVGNFRILDNNGYEYRTNSVNPNPGFQSSISQTLNFNFNTKADVILSDVVGIVFNIQEGEVVAADLSDNYVAVDVDILNEDEVMFSCRNVVFACTDQNNPLLDSLLETVNNSCCGASSSVASFEYGINNSIPHSKGGELLCPGNIISNGVVTLDRFPAGDGQDRNLTGFVGMNNGNGRGSMDGIWFPDILTNGPPG